jgi:hypothetical protein
MEFPFTPLIVYKNLIVQLCERNFEFTENRQPMIRKGWQKRIFRKITAITSLGAGYNLIKSSTLRPDGVLLTFKNIGMPKEPGIRGKPGEIKNDVFNYIPLILFNFTIA